MRNKSKNPLHLFDPGTWFEKKKPVIVFVAKLGGLMLLFYGLLAIPLFDALLYVNLEASAWLSHLILNALGQHTSLVETVISSPQFAITICRGCDAVEPTFLFCAAVVSFRAPRMHKMIGIVAGALLLHLLNLARTVTLFWIGAHHSEAFNAIHLEIWPAAFIVVEALLFLGWIHLSSQHCRVHA